MDQSICAVRGNRAPRKWMSVYAASSRNMGWGIKRR